MANESYDPVIERIAETLYRRLCKLVSPGTTSSNLFEEVIRPSKREEVTPRNRQVWLEEGAEERLEELDRPGAVPAVAYQMVFDIKSYVMPSDFDDVPWDTVKRRVISTIIRAVTVPANWRNFANSSGTQESVDAEFLSPFDLEEDDLPGFILPLKITYRVSELAPETVRL